MGGSKRAVSDRQELQASDKLGESLEHKISLKEAKDRAKKIKEIVAELEKRGEKVAKAHELVVCSDLCLPGHDKKIVDGVFSDNYRKLRQMPKSFLETKFLPALRPDVAQSLWETMSRQRPTLLYELMYAAILSHPKAGFGPKTHKQWLDEYIARAEGKGNFIENITIAENLEIDWMKEGLYRLLPLLPDDPSEEILASHRFQEVSIGPFQVSLGDFQGVVSPKWQIVDNFDWKSASLLSPSSGQLFPLHKFFKDTKGFRDHVQAEYSPENDFDEGGSPGGKVGKKKSATPKKKVKKASPKKGARSKAMVQPKDVSEEEAEEEEEEESSADEPPPLPVSTISKGLTAVLSAAKRRKKGES
mmetsp:Transcript_46761/g.111211  ORF Transcript_46761/g.111211 Transcript_46761/m.111211 type:complete len:360 (-) Transcript_46761:68-1147(-)